MISQRYRGCTKSKATMPRPEFRRPVTVSTGLPFVCFADEENEGPIITNASGSKYGSAHLSNRACYSAETDQCGDHSKEFALEGARARKCNYAKNCDIDLQVEVEGLLCEQDRITKYLASAIFRMSKVLAKMADPDKGERMSQAVRMMVQSHQKLSEQIALTVRDVVQEQKVESPSDRLDHKRRASFLSITSQQEKPCKRFHSLEDEEGDKIYVSRDVCQFPCEI